MSSTLQVHCFRPSWIYELSLIRQQINAIVVILHILIVVPFVQWIMVFESCENTSLCNNDLGLLGRPTSRLVWHRLYRCDFIRHRRCNICKTLLAELSPFLPVSDFTTMFQGHNTIRQLQQQNLYGRWVQTLHGLLYTQSTSCIIMILLLNLAMFKGDNWNSFCGDKIKSQNIYF